MNDTLRLCGQFDVLGEACPECGGWLHRVERGGFAGPHGVRYCDQECIDDFVEHVASLGLRP